MAAVELESKDLKFEMEFDSKFVRVWKKARWEWKQQLEIYSKIMTFRQRIAINAKTYDEIF